jgi:ubiquinone/menaquinone biosynthesis C-methylase UbiE
MVSDRSSESKSSSGSGEPGRAPQAQAVDWGVGLYETTARRLLPAAQEVVDRAAPKPGEHLLDVGCGTGNAALLALEMGARVTGVDPAQRLLQVARARAEEEGMGAQAVFLPGYAESLPVDSASVDVAVSVFAVIFSASSTTVAAEVSRVLKAHGRFVLSAWIPRGAMFEMTSAAANILREAVGSPIGPEQFAWYDRAALADLLAPQGFGVELEQHSVSFTAPTAKDYLEDQLENHPVAVSGMGALEQLGRAELLRERSLEIFENANEDRTAFRITSEYVVAVATR